MSTDADSDTDNSDTNKDSEQPSEVSLDSDNTHSAIDISPPQQPEPLPESGNPAIGRSKSFPWLFMLLLLLLLVVSGISTYGHWWHYQQSQQQQLFSETTSEQLQRQSRELQQVQQRSEQTLQSLRSELEQQLQSALQENRQLQQAQSTLSQQLDAQNQRLLQLSSVNSQNWELAEALYLTRLAGQRLVMEHNREAALALLLGAEEIIGRQQNPKLFSVRETINNDIAALKLVPTVDKEGLFLQLSAIHKQLQNLPITTPINYQPELTEFPRDLAPQDLEEQEQNWWGKVKSSVSQTVQQLDKYVRKIDLEAPPTPLLSPEDQESIRLSASIYIESAQIALLRDHTNVYHNALKQAADVIAHYYPESNQRAELVHAIEDLQNQFQQTTLPDISESYRQLNQFIQAQTNSAEARDIPSLDKPSMDKPSLDKPSLDKP